MANKRFFFDFLPCNALKKAFEDDLMILINFDLLINLQACKINPGNTQPINASVQLL